MAKTTVEQPESGLRSLPYKHFRFSREEVDRVTLPGSAYMRFVDRTADLASGVLSVLELMAWDDDYEAARADSDHPEELPPRVLSEFHRGNLSRLSVAVLGELVDQCERTRKWAYEVHTEAGRKEAAANAAPTFK